MFEAPQPRPRSTRSQILSFVFHGLLAWLLLAPPKTIFVTPYAVQLGNHGHSVALVFNGTNQAEISDPEDARKARHNLGYIPPDAKTIRMRAPDLIAANKPRSKPAPTVATAARAGETFGTVLDGPLTGHDIRPA